MGLAASLLIIMMKILRIEPWSVAKGIAWLSLLGIACLRPAPIFAASEVQATGAGLTSKVAPGELLPLSVKLINLGNSNKVDVALTYRIVDSQGNVIYSAEETVAVETTASFVKNIPIPASTPPGQYKAESSIRYQGQVTPATSEFSFTVERKIFGLFQSDFYLYGGIALLVGIIVGIVSRFWIRRRRTTRLGPIDYSSVPSDTRVFYELISDTIMGMRQQVGDKALDIVRQMKGITIDDRTGRVLTITAKPSKVIAELVAEYEKALHKKVSFSFRKS
jgi:Putative transmembrane protein (Alph_Pro_TM)